jgi:hypothetical protein
MAYLSAYTNASSIQAIYVIDKGPQIALGITHTCHIGQNIDFKILKQKMLYNFPTLCMSLCFHGLYH